MTKKPEIPIGTAAVIGGKLVVNKEKDSEFPKITVGENVIVKINGEKQNGTFGVDEEHNVEISSKKIDSKNEILLKISRDYLTVNLEVLKHKGKKFILDYIPAARELKIEATRYENVESKRITVKDLNNFLKKEGITFGIIEDALIKLAEEEVNEAIVAKGVAPQKGEDARIGILVGENEEKNAEYLTDIIGTREILMVEKDQPLAVKIPPKPGKAGIDVYGKTIPPEEPKDIILVAGRGARLENCDTVYAEYDGRLCIDKNRISVLPVYYVKGDAEAKEGYIDFNGDIKITGDVLDGMKLFSKGKIEILGFAANSKLTAFKDVVVEKSIVSSFVKTGSNVMLIRQVKDSHNQIYEEILDLVNALKQMKKSTEKAKKEITVGQMLKCLLENKYIKLPQFFSNNLQLLEKLDNDIDELSKDKLKKMITINESWQKKTTGLGPFEIKKVGDLDYMLREFNNCYQELVKILNDESENASITCSYVQNSNLEASGDIVINGKGSYNSNLVSGGKVLIQGLPGVVKGGSITSLGDIRVRELGSKAESKGLVQISKGSTIYADVIYPGIMIKCGAFIKKIKNTEYNFKFNSSDI